MNGTGSATRGSATPPSRPSPNSTGPGTPRATKPGAEFDEYDSPPWGGLSAPAYLVFGVFWVQGKTRRDTPPVLRGRCPDALQPEPSPKKEKPATSITKATIAAAQ